MAAPKTYEDCWLGLGAAIPWLAGGENGQAYAGTFPAVLDSYKSLMRDARNVAYPDFAPSDALVHLGNDRRLAQGSGETEANFRARLKTPWDQWARAGTWLGLLVQLYWYGLTNAVIVQQNGKQAKLTGAPVVGQDPTSLYSFTDTAELSTILTSASSPFRTVPVGAPWFQLDLNSDFCSCFAIILPSWPFASLAFANFSNTDSATVTWPVPFPDANYGLIYGPPVGPYIINADGQTKTASEIVLRASSAYGGSIPVVAWEASVNPFNLWSAASTGVLQSIIENFRPNARCVGVYTIQTGGRTWDYFPAGTTWDGGTYPTWDTNTTAQILGAF